jgi:hypothetical protein
MSILTLLILYFAWLQEWQMIWGATDEDVSRYIAGDELLENPALNAIHTVEIKVYQEQVWPWLVQMGFKRAGLYSFGNLDNSHLHCNESTWGFGILY